MSEIGNLYGMSLYSLLKRKATPLEFFDIVHLDKPPKSVFD